MQKSLLLTLLTLLGHCHQNLIISLSVPNVCLCKFGRNPPNGSEDADIKLRGRRHRRDPHRKRFTGKCLCNKMPLADETLK